MSLHRFYAPEVQSTGEAIRLSGPEAHHAAQVLRVRAGDTVSVLNGHGLTCLCQVLQVSGKELHLKVRERKNSPAPPCRVTLYQAIPKGGIMEDIIQKATELGVHRVIPVITERVVARPSQDEYAKKQAKWHAVAVEASKQCGQAWLPHVSAPARLNEALGSAPRCELELVGAIEPAGRHPSEWFRNFSREQNRKPASIAIWIGPEGDFTPAELTALVGYGVRPITLGQLILRCETAAVYCLSIAAYETQA